jgi:hypothetical protein
MDGADDRCMESRWWEFVEQLKSGSRLSDIACGMGPFARLTLSW